MKVSAVDSYRLNHINFESRKNTDVQKPVHTSSPIKAIPVALLIAMSPVNAPKTDAHGVTQTNPKTLIQNTKDKVVDSEKYPNATLSNYYDCTINYISNDGDDSTINRLQFVFHRREKQVKKENGKEVLVGYRDVSNIINFSTLKKINIKTIYEDGDISFSNRYFVEGPGSIFVITKDLQGNVISRDNSKQNNLKMEITKNFFEDLKSISDNSINYIEENEVYDL